MPKSIPLWRLLAVFAAVLLWVSVLLADDQKPTLSKGMEFYCLQLSDKYFTAQVLRDKDASTSQILWALLYDIYARTVVNFPEYTPIIFFLTFATILVFCWATVATGLYLIKPAIKVWIWYRTGKSPPVGGLDTPAEVKSRSVYDTPVEEIQREGRAWLSAQAYTLIEELKKKDADATPSKDQ